MKISRGATRIVFIFKDRVIKIPNFLDSWMGFLYGFIGNMLEADTWRSTHDARLCPVLAASRYGFWVVMRRADPIHPDDFEFLEDSRYSEFTQDLHESNFGIVDNRFVLIDYA